MLQFSAQGNLRPCEFGNQDLASNTSDWQAAWQSPKFESLRKSLANGQLPADYCGGCAKWDRAGILAQAPLARSYGHLKDNPGLQPSRIVL